MELDDGKETDDYPRPKTTSYRDSHRDSYRDTYKSDLYRADSYKSDSYKADSYKEDSYKEDSYKSNEKDYYRQDDYEVTPDRVRYREEPYKKDKRDLKSDRKAMDGGKEDRKMRDSRSNRDTTRDVPPRKGRPNEMASNAQYDDLPLPPPRKHSRRQSRESPDILEVKEISKPNRKLSSEKQSTRRTSEERIRSRVRSRERSKRSRSRSPRPRSREGSPWRGESRGESRGHFKPIGGGSGSKHYLSRNSPDRRADSSHLPIVRKKHDPNDFFNEDLKKAIVAGRIKITEKELLADGPNYSHTTNGKEEQYQKCRIFVGHLPVDFLSKDDIYWIFEKYGKILAISLHKGYAFLQFKNSEMAELAATSENGRRVKGACLEVNLATISKEEARKLPREGATLPAIHRTTPQCRIFIESEHDRMYATQIERKLRALGIEVDTTIWKETSRKSRYHGLDDHLVEMQTDPDSICAIQVAKDDIKRKTGTVHIFKSDLEGILA